MASNLDFIIAVADWHEPGGMGKPWISARTTEGQERQLRQISASKAETQVAELLQTTGRSVYSVRPARDEREQPRPRSWTWFKAAAAF